MKKAISMIDHGTEVIYKYEDGTEAKFVEMFCPFCRRQFFRKPGTKPEHIHPNCYGKGGKFEKNGKI